MNWILMCAAWRGALSPFRLPILLTLLLYPLVKQAADGTDHAANLVMFFALAAGAGVIAADRSSGMVQIILARPVSRTRYILIRWLGLSSLIAALAVAQIAASVVIASFLSPDGTPAMGDIAAAAAAGAVVGAASAASVVLASTLVPAGLDAVMLFAVVLVAALINEAADAARLGPWVGKVTRIVANLATPQFDPTDGLRALLILASNASLALLLAVFVMNRRELPARSAS